MNVHATGHDYHSGGIERSRAVRQRRDHPSIFNADVSDFPVYSIRRVMDSATEDAQPLWRAHAGRWLC
jgi:hypothetical protein